MRLIRLDYPASLVAPYAVLQEDNVIWKGEWSDRPDYISDDLHEIVEKEGSIDLVQAQVNNLCDLAFRLADSPDFDSDILPKFEGLAAFLRGVV
jgi:predicted O-methyltransferase YrrM